jgi:hypothetical protein
MKRRAEFERVARDLEKFGGVQMNGRNYSVFETFRFYTNYASAVRTGAKDRNKVDLPRPNRSNEEDATR